MADTMNGFPVIMAMQTAGGNGTLPGRVIAVDTGRDFDRYVTAWAADGSSSWCHGHYINSLDDAREDFMTRCRRGY